MEKIKMLVGQEGPALSRVPGQELAVGTDVDAEEAQRLVDADFAAEVVADAGPAASSTASASSAQPAAVAAPPAKTAAKPVRGKSATASA